MGNFQLFHGDCLEVMPTLDKVDFILSDIPYGTIACSWDVIIPFTPMWNNIERLRKENTAVALFSRKPFTALLISSNLDNYKYDWIWEKPKASGYPSVKKRPLSAHEEINIFYKHNYYPQMQAGKKYKQPRKKINYDNTMSGAFKVRADDYEFKDNDGTRFPRSILNFRNSYYDDGQQLHPTQKPESLMRYFIFTYSKPGDTILDFTMGSGTTGVACMQTNRNFIGIEKENKYFNIAQERIAAAKKQPSLI